MERFAAMCLCGVLVSCAQSPPRPLLTFTASGLGAEADVVRAQLARFAAVHPGVDVQLRVTPDAADQRHQLYVQWLNARATEPDVLQLDIVWTAEFAGAGWILPLDAFGPDAEDFFAAAVASNRWRGALYAIPWFVDVGLLYWRTDLVRAAPASLEVLREAAFAEKARGTTQWGLAWQGARYEGLVTVFVEHLAAFGGGILGADGAVIVDEPEAVEALTFMRESVVQGLVPASTLTWQEEQVRFAFQNGQTAFMRNWPYAWALLRDAERSRVAGRVGISPFPGAAGRRGVAALGGAQLAINAFTEEPELAWALVAFLTAPEQMLERARVAAQLPSRRSLYESTDLQAAMDMPLDAVRAAVESAVPRPVTPVYSELSEVLQVHVHRALTGQQTPERALAHAAADMRRLLARAGLADEVQH